MEHNIITKELRLEVGQALWEARRKKKLRLSSVAEAINVNEKYIDLIEMGRVFEFSLVRKLANFYGVSVKVVFD